MSLRTPEKLQKLIENTIQYYQEALEDRESIHDIEWNQSEDQFSILFEMEVLSSDIVGCVTRIGSNETSTSLCEELSKYDVLGDIRIKSWTEKNEGGFPRYVTYIHCVDKLRIEALKYLNEIRNA